MTSKKWTIIITTILCGISFIIFLVLQFQLYHFLGLYGGTEFYENLRIAVITISSGVFTGAIVILLVSIKEYIHERKKALMNIYSELFEIRNAFMKIKPFIPDEPIEIVAECFSEIDRNSLFEDLNMQLAENNPDVKTDQLFSCSYEAKEKYKYARMSNLTNEWIAELKTLYNLNEELEHEYTQNMERYALELGESIDSYIEIENLSNKGLALAIEELDFLFGNKTIKRRYEKLNDRIIDTLGLIHSRTGSLKSFYEKGALKGTYCILVNEMQNKIFREEDRYVYRFFAFLINNEMTNTILIANGKKPRKNMESDKMGYIIYYKRT